MGGINTKEVEDRMWGHGGGDLKDVKRSRSKSPSKRKGDEVKKIREYSTGEEIEINDDQDHEVDNYDPKTAGPIFPDGNINWDCPCLGGAAYGPCGTEFRQAFSCFHFSKEETKGSDCFPNFRDMHTCFSKYPDLYGPKEGDEDNDEEDIFDEDELEVIKKETEDDEKSREKSSEKEEKEKHEDPKKSADSERKETNRKSKEPDIPSPRGSVPAIL